MSTFDWDRYWESEEEPERARQFSIKMADMLGTVIQNKGLETVAEYGCGRGTLLFILAKRFSDKRFYGFDVARSVVKKNRKEVVQSKLNNIYFEQDTLPVPKRGERYDLVMCFATLHYVKEIDLAVRNLFELVNSGGYLIFNYPNIYSKKAYQRDISPGDECMKRRFALVLAGENLLSLRKIKRLLGVTPRKFYSSRKSNIYASIHKRR